MNVRFEMTCHQWKDLGVSWSCRIKESYKGVKHWGINHIEEGNEATEIGLITKHSDLDFYKETVATTLKKTTFSLWQSLIIQVHK